MDSSIPDDDERSVASLNRIITMTGEVIDSEDIELAKDDSVERGKGNTKTCDVADEGPVSSLKRIITTMRKQIDSSTIMDSSSSDEERSVASLKRIITMTGEVIESEDTRAAKVDSVEGETYNGKTEDRQLKQSETTTVPTTTTREGSRRHELLTTKTVTLTPPPQVRLGTIEDTDEEAVPVPPRLTKATSEALSIVPENEEYNSEEYEHLEQSAFRQWTNNDNGSLAGSNSAPNSFSSRGKTSPQTPINRKVARISDNSNSFSWSVSSAAERPSWSTWGERTRQSDATARSSNFFVQWVQADEIVEAIPLSWYGKIWNSIYNLYRKNEVFTLILLAILLARIYPPLGAKYLARKVTSQYIAVMFIFFLSGLGLKTKQFSQALNQLQFNAYVQVYNFLFVSAVVFGITRALISRNAFDTALADGMVICSCLPMTISSVGVLTNLSGGDEAAAVFNSAFGSMLSVVLTPSLILLYLQEGGDETDVGEVFLKLAIRVVAPVAVGQLLQKKSSWAVQFVATYKVYFARAQLYCVIFIVYTVFCVHFSNESATEVAQIFYMIIWQFVFLVWFMIFSWFFMKYFFPDKPKLRVMGLFGTTQKTMAMGVPMIEAIYGGNNPNVGLYTLPLLVWYPLQLVIGSLIYNRLKKFATAERLRLRIEKDRKKDLSQKKERKSGDIVNSENAVCTTGDDGSVSLESVSVGSQESYDNNFEDVETLASLIPEGVPNEGKARIGGGVGMASELDEVGDADGDDGGDDVVIVCYPSLPRRGGGPDVDEGTSQPTPPTLRPSTSSSAFYSFQTTSAPPTPSSAKTWSDPEAGLVPKDATQPRRISKAQGQRTSNFNSTSVRTSNAGRRQTNHGASPRTRARKSLLASSQLSAQSLFSRDSVVSGSSSHSSVRSKKSYVQMLQEDRTLIPCSRKHYYYKLDVVYDKETTPGLPHHHGVCCSKCVAPIASNEREYGKLPSKENPLYVCKHCKKFVVCNQCWKKETCQNLEDSLWNIYD